MKIIVKTMISRVYRIGDIDSPEDAGKIEATLNKIGVAVRNAENEFKPFTEIIAQLGEKWKTLNTVEQVAVAQAVGKVLPCSIAIYY